METAKHYPGSSDSQMSEMEIHRVVKSPARISKMEWRRMYILVIYSNKRTTCVSIIFFNQQFITQGVMAGHSNYKVATLH